MQWSDTEVWLPTLLVSDFVMFPQCRIRIRIDEAMANRTFRSLLNDGCVINIFWTTQEENDSSEFKMSTIGTISRVQEIRSKSTDDSRALHELTLFGLSKIRCEAIRGVHERFESRFRIMQEIQASGKPSWKNLLEDLIAWVQFANLYLTSESTLLLDRQARETPIMFINRMCMTLPLEAALKQSLLEMPTPYDRGRALEKILRETVDQMTQRHSVVPEPTIQ